MRLCMSVLTQCKTHSSFAWIQSTNMMYCKVCLCGFKRRSFPFQVAFHILQGQSLPNVTKTLVFKPLLLLRSNAYKPKKRSLNKREKGKKKGNKGLDGSWENVEERKRMAKTQRGRRGKSKTCIEKEMKKRLYWGALVCETGPFRVN